MMSLDLINVGADAVLVVIIATSYRMSMIKQARLEEKIEKTLSRAETKAMIEEEIETHLKFIQSEIKSINNTLNQIVEIKVKS